MNGARHRLQQFEGVLKALLDASRPAAVRRPRFPAAKAENRRSLVAAGLIRDVPAGGSLFGAGGSISKGRVRHFRERDFEPVPLPGFSPVADTRRMVSSRRHPFPAVRSGWRNLLHVLLHR
jgi:hypothetical protein